jgi:hypothetical protein
MACQVALAGGGIHGHDAFILCVAVSARADLSRGYRVFSEAPSARVERGQRAGCAA